MTTVELPYDSELTEDTLYAYLKRRLGDRYQLHLAPRRQTRRQQRIHGMQWVVIVQRSKLCGAFVRVEQKPGRTRVKIWTDAPSEAVFKTFALIPLLLPLLIFVLPVVKFGSAPIAREVRDIVGQMPQHCGAAA